MFNVLNKITVDAIISPKSDGERELAAFHFLKLLPRDLILLDRGYPAHWLFKLVLSLDANFCARISYKRWNAAKKFYQSGKKEQIVKIKPSPQSVRCQAFFRTCRHRFAKYYRNLRENELLKIHKGFKKLTVVALSSTQYLVLHRQC